MNRPQTSTLATMLGALAMAATLAACDRQDDGRTAGQKVDDTVASAERKTDQAAADARSATANAGNAVADGARDARITTAVNAALVGDPQLSAMRINVDSSNGAVTLSGTAPDAASRDRATQLAQAVDGVANVNNQLTVKPKN